MLRLAVRVDRAHAELVLAPAGVEEVDIDADTVEYAVYGAPGELPLLPDLQAAAGGVGGQGGIPIQVSSTEIADDWAERWREFHRPLVLGDRLTVRPPWEPPGPTELDVVIDPGRAFGTGAHATTALCLELLLESTPARGRCIDLGCGSGVLGILAARLGFTPVLALDHDPLAVAASAENAARNGVLLEARRLDLRVEQVPDAELVLANVLAGPLLGWAGTQRRLPPRLILSGLLATEADRVAQAYARRGLHERARRTSGDWAALALAGTPG